MTEMSLETAPHQLTAHRKSLDALTGIRFFAAFYVVLFHTRIASTFAEHGHQAAGNFFSNGFLAVPLFFLLSGFILAYTYKGQIEKPGDHRRFWEARFARIWPVYAVSLFSASATTFTLPPFGTAIATLFMVQAWNPFDLGMAGAWNFVCWTLSVEALFYLCFPWVQTWIEDRPLKTQLIGIGLMLLICVSINSGSRSLGSHSPYLFSSVPLPLLHLPEFFTGVGLGNYFSGLFKQTKSASSGARTLPGRGIWTYLSVLVTIGLLCRGASPWTSLIVVAFAALIFGLAAERTLLSRFLSTPIMLLGGGISYSMYLMQVPVKILVLLLADRLHYQSQALRMGATGILLITISLILFWAVENPARRLLRTGFARLEERREAKQLVGKQQGRVT